MDRSDDLALRDGFTAANYASITRVLLNQFRFFCVGQLFEPDLLTGAVPILVFLQHKPHALQQFSRIFRDCGRRGQAGRFNTSQMQQVGQDVYKRQVLLRTQHPPLPAPIAVKH